MAGNNSVNVSINVTDNGSVDKVTKKVKSLKDLLDQTAISAGNLSQTLGGLNIPPVNRPAGASAGTSAGGTSGSNRAAASAAAGSNRAAASAPAGSTNNPASSYAAQRAVAGAGGGARNFAAEAQGINGLVKIYATLAANLYVAATAFMALKDAANTQILIKGVEQLGNASGKNLKGVALNIVELTEGAVTLKDSLQIVAKASSAGISSDNIERLASAAKKAGQALGLDTATAIDRLSRGITKLEPELLDELGLFTKIGPATQEYARSVGKSAIALTDFERRQAFANAVLTEAEQKFGALDSVGNPFEKLQATLSNTLLKVLMIITDLLKPIVALLAENPMGLAIAIGLLTKSLISGAVPALGAWKENMRAATEQYKANAAAAVLARRENRAWNDSVIGQQVGRAQAAAATTAQAKAQELLNAANNNASKFTAKTKAAVQRPGFDVKNLTDTDVKALEKAKAAAEDKLSRMSANSTALRAARQAEIDFLKNTLDAQKAKNVANEAANQLDRNRPGFFSQAMRDDREARAQLLQAQKSTIQQNALERQSLDGTVAGFKQLHKEIQLARQGYDAAGVAYTDGTKKLGIFSTITTYTAGSLRLLGGALSAVGDLASKALFWIGLLTAAYQLFSVWLTTSKKESAAFSSATEKLRGSVEMVSGALENISKKKFLSIETIQQTANAFNDVTDAVNKQVTAFANLKMAQSSFDSFVDSVMSVFRKGIKDDLANSVSDAIFSALRLIDDPKVQAEFKNKLLIDVGIDTSSTAKTKADIRELATNSVLGLETSLSKVFKQLNININNSASNLTQLGTGLTEIGKQVNDLNSTLKLTDVQGKLGTTMLAEAPRLAKALEDPKNAIIALEKIVSDFNTLTVFSPEIQQNLINSKQQIEDISKAYQSAESSLKLLNERQRKQIEVYGRPSDYLQVQIDDQQALLNQQKAAAKQIQEKFQIAVNADLVEQSFKRINLSLKNAIAEAGIISARGYLSVLSSVGGKTAAEEGRLKIQELESQKLVIRETFRNSNELVKLRLTNEKLVQASIYQTEQLKINNASDLVTKQGLDKANAVRVLSLGTQEQRKKEFDTFLKGRIAAKYSEFTTPEARNKELAEVLAKTYTLQPDVPDSVLTAQRDAPPLTIEQITREAETNRAGAMKRLLELTNVESKLFLPGGGINSAAVRQEAGRGEGLMRQFATELAVNDKSMQAGLSKLDAAIKVAKLETTAAKIREDAADAVKKEKLRETGISTQLTAVTTQEQALGIYNEQIQAHKELLEQDKLISQQKQEQLTLAGEILLAEKLVEEEKKRNKGLMGPPETAAQEALDLLQAASAAKQLDNETNLAAQRVDQLRKRLTGEADVARKKAEYANKELDFVSQLASAQDDNRLQQIDNLVAIGKLTKDQATLQIAEINRAKILRDLEKERRDLKTRETDIRSKTAQDIRVVSELAKPELSGFGELGLDTDQVSTPSLIAYRAALVQLSESEKVQLGLLAQEALLQDTVTQGKLQAVNATLELNERQKAYSDIFESGIDRMTDAIMEFAKTGKISFKDLINSLIADIVRFEIKAKLMAMWMQARPFIMSLFGGSLGPESAMVGSTGFGNGVGASFAKGGAFDSGIQKFASGGAFSNSIVSSPTLFKFANGTGLMGEAGPEAIMPLKRDSSGKLGVSAPAAGKPNAGNVEVVVNNYGSDKATTKETQDSRGNRKIEVMIGDMSAGEISRSGSSSQRSMQSTYGLQPQLIRR